MRSLFLLLLLLALLGTSIVGTDASTDVCADANGSECVVDSDSVADRAAAVDADLELLLKKGVKALTEREDYAKANSIFEDIARRNPNWSEMHTVQKFNGVALAKLGQGSKALWCFKNAMMLANQYPGRQRLREHGENGYKMFAAETSHLLQIIAKEYFDKAPFIVRNNPLPDANLMHATAQLAHAAGKTKEAKLVNDIILQRYPEHGGARLLEVTMSMKDDGGDEDDLTRLYEAVEECEQHPWDAAMGWTHIGSIECRIDPRSDACIEAWINSFELAASLSPVDKDIATKSVLNASNGMFKRERSVDEVRKLGERAVGLGLLNAPLQLPGTLIRGISFMPWREDAWTWRVVRHLEENFPKMREEILAAYDTGGVDRDAVLDAEGLHTAGEWKELNIMTSGVANPPAIDLLPRTSRIVMTIADGNSMVLGGSKVSVMRPGTVVRPHTGSTNARLRIHMGVSVPEGAFLRVDNETRTWEEGRCVVIDDSYVHEVWHHGDEKRIVLIVDVWHPELGPERREEAIARPHLLEMYRSHVEDPGRTLRRQGVPGDIVPDRFVYERYG